MFNAFFKKSHDAFYIIFRIVIGLFFMQHGIQKVFGVLNFGAPAPLFTLMWAAGYIELIAGLMILFGFFTRIAAFVSGIEMAVAYVYAHAPQAMHPVLNGGELALLYFASFLIIISHGAGKFSLEKAILKREIF
ncbi:DoxX family protein [Candidatus Woesearchaeota archaeon]|nr:DoxX family protein [Candidatus Woesearchaeota archaeon]